MHRNRKFSNIQCSTIMNIGKTPKTILTQTTGGLVITKFVLMFHLVILLEGISFLLVHRLKDHFEHLYWQTYFDIVHVQRHQVEELDLM